MQQVDEDNVKDFQEFDQVQFIKDVPDGFTVMVAAARRTGKTVLITDLIKKGLIKKKFIELAFDMIQSDFN